MNPKNSVIKKNKAGYGEYFSDLDLSFFACGS